MASTFKYKNGGPGSRVGSSKEGSSSWRTFLLVTWGLVLTMLYYLWPEDDSVLAVESITKTWQCQEVNPETKEKECIHDQCHAIAQNYKGDALVFDVNSEKGYPYLPVVTANQCCKACRLHPNCNVWTYCRKEEGCGRTGQCMDGLKKGARVICNEQGKFAYHSCALKLLHEQPERWGGEPMFSTDWVSGHINRTQFGLTMAQAEQ